MDVGVYIINFVRNWPCSVFFTNLRTIGTQSSHTHGTLPTPVSMVIRVFILGKVYIKHSSGTLLKSPRTDSTEYLVMSLLLSVH